MRPHSDRLPEVLRGSYDKQWVADLYYAGNRLMTDLPITAPKFDDDGTSLVQSTGSCTIVYTSAFAESLSPASAGDILAPFGAELAVYVIIRAGQAFTERIQMGWYRITDVPSASDDDTLFLGRRITVGSTIQLTLQDRFVKVQRDRFDIPSSPALTQSVLLEVSRLTGLQITQSVTDGPITAAVAYQEDRLQAVYDLVGILDAIPYVQPDGTLGQRPNDWPDPVDELNTGDRGTLITVGRALSADNVYNVVVVRSSGTDTEEVLATAAVTDGPLRASNGDGSASPYGRVPYFAASQFVTADQAPDYAQKLLPRVSNLNAAMVPITEKFNPLREVGDVLDVRPSRGAFTGRVTAINRDSGATQKLTLEVQ